MDDKLKAEFPLGNHMIVVTEPSPGQLFALALSRNAKDTDADRTRIVFRVLKILEALTGPEQWYDVIEDAMISEEISAEQLLGLAMAVFQFPWAEHHAPDPTDYTLQAAIGQAEVEPLPAAPQPRIIRD